MGSFDSSIDLQSLDVVAAYDELPLWSAMAGLLLLEHVELKHELAVLDLGFGTGFPLLELAQRLGESSTVYGLDPWAPAVARTRFKARVRGVRNVALVRGEAQALPFADASFDLLVSNLGLNNFRDQEAVLSECRRVARPGSRLALSTNLQGHMKEMYDVFEATLAEVGDARALESLKVHLAHRTTVAGLSSLFSRTGFRLLRRHERSLTMRFADATALFSHFFIRLGFLDDWKAVIEESRREKTFAKFEENLNRVARVRGELALTIPFAFVEAEPIFD